MTDALRLRSTPGVARLLVVALIDRTGSGLFVPISVVYLHRTVSQRAFFNVSYSLLLATGIKLIWDALAGGH